MAVNPTDPALDVPYEVSLHKEAPRTFKLTVRPSPLDPRDYMSGLAPKKVLPTNLVLPACYDPLDQGRLGSCTANGMAGMYASEQLIGGKQPDLLSRLALYYAERVTEGSVNEDNGAVPRDGLLVLKNNGVGLEQFWPYDITKFTQPPAPEEVADAPNHKIKGFYRVPGLLAAKAALFNKHPVGIAMLVFNGMETTRNGVIPLPSPGEQPLGGHWVYLRGYQDRKDWPGGGYLIIRNSWGANAGNGHGDYLLPYSYAGNSQLVSEYWYIQL